MIWKNHYFIREYQNRRLISRTAKCFILFLASILSTESITNNLRRRELDDKINVQEFSPMIVVEETKKLGNIGTYFDFVFAKDRTQNKNAKKLSNLGRIMGKIFSKLKKCQTNIMPGGYCNSNKECLSGVCVDGICFASSECQALKYDGDRFDIGRINLIFVGSGFSSLNDWRVQVKESFSSFSKFKMFSNTNERFNAFYVSLLSPSFCDFGCGGIDRLLCCDVAIAKRLADNCFPSGTRQQTIVVHEDERYGGAGYLNSNLATISTHIDGPYVAIHELGHSLFNLADEYDYGEGSEFGPNCDLGGCNKWKDLMNEPDVVGKYGSIRCLPGCKDNAFFVGEVSFMNLIKAPVGAVNERFTCCTFLALTGGYPDYCQIFNFRGNGLAKYCELDHQHYSSPRPISPLHTNLTLANSLGYIDVENPVQATILLQGNTPSVTSVIPISSGIFSRTKVHGEFEDYSHAAALGVDTIVQVQIKYPKGNSNTLLFNPKTLVDIPPHENISVSPISTILESRMKSLLERFSGHEVYVNKRVLEIVLNNEVEGISISYVNVAQMSF